MTPDEQRKSDLMHLVKQPEFIRAICLPVIQMSGIFSSTTDGSEGRDLAVAAQARKHLGLEILSMVEQGQPVPHPSGQPRFTILQALREEANQPQENKRERRDQYDRNRDLDDGDD